MLYVGMIILVLSIIYLLNYAKYEWKKNKSAAMGSFALAVISILLPVLAIIAR